MFDQIKKINQLRNIQNSIKKEKAAVERQGIRVVINGGFEVEEIKLNSGLETGEQERILKECLNEAKDNIQKIIAKQFMDSGMAGHF